MASIMRPLCKFCFVFLVLGVFLWLMVSRNRLRAISEEDDIRASGDAEGEAEIVEQEADGEEAVVEPQDAMMAKWEEMVQGLKGVLTKVSEVLDTQKIQQDEMQQQLREQRELFEQQTEQQQQHQSIQSQYFQHVRDELELDGTQVNWTDVYKFVPRGLRSCQDLFADSDIGNIFDQDFRKDYIKFEHGVRKHTWQPEGHIGLHREEYITLHMLVMAPFVKTVCEIGFNAGHSAFMWLRSRPDVRVSSFDIGTHRYTPPMVRYLQEAFPDRLNMVWGDTRESLPRFVQEHDNFKCDLILIDGGHTYDECKSDLDHMRLLASKNHILIYDNAPDVRYPGVVGAWDEAKQQGQVAEAFSCNYLPAKEQGFTVGRFTSK